jgi:hypothetical protein
VETPSDLVGYALTVGPFAVAGAGLVKALLGKPFSVAGEMLGDQMYAWRIGRLLRVAERTSKLLADSGIEARQLPTGPLIPLLEACASSASDEISDIFGNLLASAVADDEFHRAITKSCGR